MKRCQFYITTLIVLLAAACSESTKEDALDDAIEQESSSSTEVDTATLRISAAVDGYVLTRAGKEAWGLGDKIDVACEITKLLSSEYTLLLDFVEYSVCDTSTGELLPSVDAVEVNFNMSYTNSYIALYPAGLIAAGSNQFSVDLTDQSSGVDELDLLYATTVKSQQASTDTDLSLNFTHQYAIVTFKFDTTQAIAADAELRLYGAYSKAKFDVTSGTFSDREVEAIEMKLDTATNSSSVLVLPWQNMSDIRLVLYSDGVAHLFEPDIVDENGQMVVWEANKQYQYTVTL